jgi:ATP-dependent HslUV protease ATP-binding subunit HslU
MIPPMQNLTPRQIVEQLDKYIVGQSAAKRAVAIAVRNRWRRQQLPADVARDVYPKNILMMGPTGVGKTEIARRLATLTGAPFIKIEATKFTEVGYVGRDVDSMIRDLVEASIQLVRVKLTEAVKEQASAGVEDRILDLLLPGSRSATSESEEDQSTKRTRDRLRDKLRSGEMENDMVEMQVETKTSVVGMLGPQGVEMDPEMQNMFEKLVPAKRETRKVTIAEARTILLGQEADKLVDKEKVKRTAIELAENSGIVFLDEIDKIATSGKESGPDVSRQGVQRDLLPIVEGSTVNTKHGQVKTDHILFIAAGAFHVAKPSDLMPELQGRFPIRVELQALTKADLERILREPKNSLSGQQVDLLRTEGLRIEFTDDAIEAMAQIAFEVNKRTQDIGARRLHTIMERVFEEISFDAPELKQKQITIDAKYVSQRLSDVLEDEDLSKYIL